MVTIREAADLAGDRDDLLRSCGEAEAVNLWPALVAAWETIPTRARRRLRGRFSLQIVAGKTAAIGLPLATAAIGRPLITIGREAPDPGLSFAHELAHLALGHLPARTAGPVILFVGRDIAEGDARRLVETGTWRRRELTPEELRRERAAWRLCARWGFTVPAWTGEGNK